jgi:16S rRNA G966 N2-methylase RsmD
MIQIDPEFQALIPPLATEEKQQLEANILADGCRDPLVVWNVPVPAPANHKCYGSDQTKCNLEPGFGVWHCTHCDHNPATIETLLIDGHNRYEICTKHSIDFETVERDFADRSEAIEWIIRNQFGRRNLSAYVRTHLALRLEETISKRAKANQVESGREFGKGCQKSDKPISPIDTKKEVAKAANVSHDTVAKVKIINKAVDAGKVAPEVVAKLHSGEVSINKVVKDVKEAATAERRTTQRREAASQADPSLFDNIHVGDFRDHFDKVADGSLSLIFTDPPYDRKAIELFDGLGEFAASKLADGGSLMAYVGHIQIQDALNALSKHLRYWWVCCCLHSGGESLMREYGIRVGWKAVLWFVKGTRDDKQDIVHDVMSGGREKSHHDWQQSQSEAEYWIDHLCPIDGIVCDPFLGGGTTAAAAKSLGRKWIAFEKCPDQAKIAMGRLSQ